MILKQITEDNRNIYIDFLKVIAIIMIIVTHDPWSVSNGDLPLFVFFVDMAVPIFMIVSGYNYANGKHDIIKEEYRLSYITRRLKRFIIPYLLVFGIEVILLIVVKDKEYTLTSLLIDFVRGGYGPGAYYTPVMVQFVFLVPLLWNIYNKFGIFVIFIINFLFESIYTFAQFPESIYGFIIFRYIFLISLGFEMNKRKDKANMFWGVLFIVGAGYLLSTCYLYTPIIFKRWTTTSMMSGLYLFPILLLGKKFYDSAVLQNGKYGILILTSKATFHIYLVQMLYYYIGVQRIFRDMSIGVRICFNVLVCMICGNIFYSIMQKIKNFGVKRNAKI